MFAVTSTCHLGDTEQHMFENAKIYTLFTPLKDRRSFIVFANTWSDPSSQTLSASVYIVTMDDMKEKST